MQFITGMHRPWPAEFIEAQPDDAAGGFELTLDQEPHGHGSGVPAARCESAKNGPARRLVVEMKRLRIELFGEVNRSRRLDAQPGRPVGLPDREDFEMVHGHEAIWV